MFGDKEKEKLRKDLEELMPPQSDSAIRISPTMFFIIILISWLVTDIYRAIHG